MKPEIAQRWVEALRSGEYKQGLSVLRRIDESGNGQDSYCCLGVLCEIAVAEVIENHHELL